MKGFTRPELVFVIVVLTTLAAVSLYNYGLSQQKAHDSQRAEAVSRVSDALAEYFYDNDRYPAAEKDTGRFVACGGNHENPDPCPWGSKLYDYIELPNDPLLPDRHFFYQVSTDGAKFKFWTAMEARPPVDYGLGNDVPFCGNVRCNFGQGSSETVMSERF